MPAEQQLASDGGGAPEMVRRAREGPVGLGSFMGPRGIRFRGLMESGTGQRGGLAWR